MDKYAIKCECGYLQSIHEGESGDVLYFLFTKKLQNAVHTDEPRADYYSRSLREWGHQVTVTKIPAN